MTIASHNGFDTITGRFQFLACLLTQSQNFFKRVEKATVSNYRITDMSLSMTGSMTISRITGKMHSANGNTIFTDSLFACSSARIKRL